MNTIIQPSNNLGSTALAIAWSIWKTSHEEASLTPTAPALTEEIAKLARILSEAVD